MSRRSTMRNRIGIDIGTDAATATATATGLTPA